MCEKNGKTRWYLNVIVTIALIIIALVSWALKDAMARNDKTHEVIKDDLRVLSHLITQYVQNAPPNHIHLPDGGVARIVTDK